MSFSVVVDSQVAFKTTSIYDKDYAIDWSFLDEGEYDLTFSFVSSPAGANTTDVKGIALLGLGTQMKTYTAGEKTDTKSSNIIGLLKRTMIVNDTTGNPQKMSFSQSDFNVPVVLNSRPSNNIFKVKIMASSTIVGSVGMSGSYLLILHFNKRG
jgi:hypothetical protein